MKLRPVWLGVTADLKPGGPFDVYFVKGDGPDYRTGYEHWICWNGFFLNFDPICGYQEIRKFLYDFEATLETV